VHYLDYVCQITGFTISCTADGLNTVVNVVASAIPNWN